MLYRYQLQVTCIKILSVCSVACGKAHGYMGELSSGAGGRLAITPESCKQEFEVLHRAVITHLLL